MSYTENCNSERKLNNNDSQSRFKSPPIKRVEMVDLRKTTFSDSKKDQAKKNLKKKPIEQIGKNFGF